MIRERLKSNIPTLLDPFFNERLENDTVEAVDHGNMSTVLHNQNEYEVTPELKKTLERRNDSVFFLYCSNA